MPLAETELASQPDRQHDKIAPKPKAPSQIEGFVEQHNYKWFFKASNAPVDPTQVEKITVTVKLHAGHSADDGNRAVTSEVNRPAISPIVTVAAARRQRTPSWKNWVTQDSKTGKKLFLAKGLCLGECFVGEFDRVRSNVFRYIRQADSLIEHFSSTRAKLLEILRIKESVSYGRPLCIK